MITKVLKQKERVFAIFLLLCFFAQMTAVGLIEEINTQPKDMDPYALMYDSDSVILDRINEFYDFEATQTEYEMNKASDPEDVLDVKKSEASVLLDKEADKQNSKEQVLTLVRSGQPDKIKELDIPEQSKQRIDEIIEDAKESRFIIKYQTAKESGRVQRLAQGSQLFEGAESKRSGDMELLVLSRRVNPKELAETLKAAGADKYIEYIQPDFKMYFSSQEDEGGLGLELIGGDQTEGADEAAPVLAEAYEEAADVVEPPEVIVAIIDTGVDITHPALMPYIWTNPNETAGDGLDNDANGYVDDTAGWDFYGDSGAVYDPACPAQSAHATHIAGIIAQAGAGVNVKLMPLKVFGENGAFTSDIIDAIRYAEENGARIANCSFGSNQENVALREAIESSGMLFVSAVGNARADLAENPVYPACFALDNNISVASTNTDGGFSYYSNYGAGVADIAARGRDVESTLPGGEYGLQSGTSMSAAQVSGAAAAVLGAQNDLDAAVLKARLIYTADRLSNLQDKVIGDRQVNLENAVLDLEQTDIVFNAPEDDFDVHGYNPTQSELYQLYTQSGDVIQAAGGEYFSCILKENGTVWAWGYNDVGQCGNGTISLSETLSQVIGLTDVVQIATGYRHSLAVKSDGTVWGWGYNYYGQLGDGTTTNRSTPVQVSGLSGVVSVAANSIHSLATKSDGTVWAWGNNSFGQLGDGTTTNRSTPVQVSGLSGVVGVDAGRFHSLAVKSDGTVWSWGWNYYGQLGEGTTTDKTTPVQVSGLTGVVGVASGATHSLAVKSDGTVRAWGWNGSGELGDGTTTSRTTPVQVSGLTGVASVNAGYSHSLAVELDGSVWAWGYNSSGQLGDGTEISRTTPVQVSGLTGVVNVAGGYYHSLAAKSDGTVWVWGNNVCGQLGDGTAITRSAPVQVSGLTGVAGVAAGPSHSLTVKSDGTVCTWGYNWYGQLGDGATTNRSTPFQVSGLTGVAGVAAGGYHSLAVKSDGTVWAWGDNETGELGDGTTTDRGTPVQVSGLSGVVSVAAGEYHSLAVKSDGTVWAWGWNYYGQLGDGTATTRKTPVQVSGLTGVVSVAAGGYHSLAVKSDGTVWAWGYNAYGQLGDGTTTNRATPVQVNGLSGVVSIAAGDSHSLAVKSDGTVWGWGYNGEGELGDGTTTDRTTPVQVSSLSGIVSVAAGYYHNLAVKSDGMVWGWGWNYYGQLGDGTTTDRTTPVQVSGLTGVVGVAAGYDHSLAVKSDNTIYAWGLDWCGQLGASRILWSTTPIQSQTFLPDISFLSDSYAATIPQSGEDTITVQAQATDAYGNVIEDAEIEYSLGTSYTGVSVDSATGVVTFTSQAQPGQAELVAQYDGLSATATLDLTQGISGQEIEITAQTGAVYKVSLTADHTESFAARSFMVTYDPDVLGLADLCAFTYEKELTTGAIERAQITILSLSPGEIVFEVDRDVPTGKTWSGVINIFSFTALDTQSTVVSVD